MRKRKLLSLYKDYPLYLWIVGVIPIVHLYSENLGLVFDNEVIPCLILMLLGTTIAFLATNNFVRNRHRTAFLLGICSTAYSLSGHVYELVFMPKPPELWTLDVLLLFAVGIVVLRHMRGRALFAQATPVLNMMMMALLAFQGANLAAGFVAMSKYEKVLNGNLATDSGQPWVQRVVQKENDSASRPDIYFIIPDGYPSDAWLRSAMNYDNSKFTEALNNRGFVVAHHAQANYASTLVSLASTLNMQHYSSNPTPFFDLDYLRLSIADNIVARQLKELGYSYIQLLSGFLMPSPMADINRDYTPRGPIDIKDQHRNVSSAIRYGPQADSVPHHDVGHFYKQSFISLYIDTTLLRPFGSLLVRMLYDQSKPYGLFAAERFLQTIEDVRSIVSMPEATFTLIHLLKPHGPTVFNEFGDMIEHIRKPTHQEYFAEFGFTNSKFLELIDLILDGSSNQPIIVFQGDHGSTYGKIGTRDGKLTHFDTYAAYHLPDTFSIDLPEPYTLINTFPLILNEVFGTEYEMQEDHLFALPVGYADPFQQIDVRKEFGHAG